MFRWPRPSIVSCRTSRIPSPSCSLRNARSRSARCNAAVAGNACIRTSWPCVRAYRSSMPMGGSPFRRAAERISTRASCRCRDRLRDCPFLRRNFIARAAFAADVGERGLFSHVARRSSANRFQSSSHSSLEIPLDIRAKPGRCRRFRGHRARQECRRGDIPSGGSCRS